MVLLDLFLSYFFKSSRCLRVKVEKHKTLTLLPSSFKTPRYYMRLAKLPLQSNPFNLQAREVIRCNQDETAMILGYDEVIRYYARLLIVVHLYKTEMDISKRTND